MKEKKFYIPDCFWDIGALEGWLEHMAGKGWQYREQRGDKALFEQVEPLECRIRLEPYLEKTSEERRAERDALYADLGWQRWGDLHDHILYACTDPSAPELHTDTATANWAREKMLDKAREKLSDERQALACVVGVVLFLTGVMSGGAVEALVCSKYSAFFLVLIPIFVAFIAKRLYDACHIRRIRREIAAQLPISHSGDWRRGKRIAAAGLVMVALLECALLGEGLWGIFSREEEHHVSAIDYALPYVPGAVLEEGGGDEEALFFTYVSFLAPKQYHIFENWEGRKQVITHYCQVRFDFLAKPLYNEWLKDEQWEYPEAEHRTLTDERFDRIDLLTTQERELLFLCQEDQVLFVNTRALSGIEEHLEDYAQMLEDFS